MDLSGMSFKEMVELRGKLSKEIEKQRASEQESVKAQIKELAEGAGINLKELTTGDRRRDPVAPKYRNPADPSKTWSGRGKSPAWVLAMKEAGTLQDAAI